MSNNRVDIVRLSILITLLAISYIYWFASSDDSIFYRLLFQHDLAGALGLLFVIAISLIPLRNAIDTREIALTVARHHKLIAGMVWIILCIGSLSVYQNHPLSMDEYAASFQAHVFASGNLAGRVPPELLDWTVPQQFQGHFLVVNKHSGQIATAYWPGFSLLLTPFVWLGIPWACNPLIVAASVLITGQLAHEITGEKSARGWAIMLAIASPAFTLNGISYYSMPAHLLFNLVFVWLLLHPSPIRIVTAGLVGSFALVLHNPYPHLLFALPWLAWMVFRREGGIRNGLLLALGYIPLVSLIGIGWVSHLESIRQFGQAITSSEAPAVQLPWIVRAAISLTHPFHLPTETTLAFRISGLAKLWLWSAPFLIVIAALACYRLQNRILKMMGASFIITVSGYFLIPVSQGHGWGDRYSHSAWGVLPILAAAWLCKSSPREHYSNALLSTTLKSALLSLILMTTLRTWQIGAFMESHLTQLPSFPEGQPSIVFIRNGYYAMDLVQNDPYLRSHPWIFKSRGQQADMELAKRLFPDGYRYSGNKHGWTYTTEK
ncbi:MAG: hypothetical protein H6943_09020 [Zoogloeaceae bacterium]|nr:hypothetical protein [Zoogloeaceae bacterium]